MHIGIAGPVSTQSIRERLRDGGLSLPVGYQGAPFMAALIGELIGRGHDISVFTTDRWLPHDTSEPVLVLGERVRVYYCPQRPRAYRFSGTTPGRILDLFRHERRHLARAIREDSPDVVHAHWTYEFALAAIESGKPHVITAHDSPRRVLCYMPSVYRLGRYIMARQVLSKARFVTAVAPYIKDELQRYSRARISIVPNPLSRTLLDEEPVFAHPNQDFQRVSMVLNGWSKLKNAKAAFIAFAKLRRLLPGLRLSAIGFDFGPGEKAERWCESEGVSEGVDFLGALPHTEVISHLRRSCVLLHPALEEAHPMAVCEAMAIGLPVVAGKAAGGVPWLVGNEGAEGLADVADVESIVRTTVRVLQHRHVWEKLSSAGRSRIRTLCDPGLVASAFEEIYRQALAQ